MNLENNFTLKQKIYSSSTAFFEANDELLNISKNLMSKMTISKKTSIEEKVSFFLLPEAYDRFFSVKLLCEEGMWRTSLIILRSLLDLLVKYRWIMKDDNKTKAKRYIGWHWKLEKDALEKEPSNFISSAKVEIEEQFNAVRELFNYIDKKGKLKQANKWHAPFIIEQMAKDGGLDKQYEDDYRFLSNFEHSDPLVVLHKLQNDKILYGPELNTEMTNEILIMNFTYFLNICEHINKTHELGYNADLQKMIERQNNFNRSKVKY